MSAKVELFLLEIVCVRVPLVIAYTLILSTLTLSSEKNNYFYTEKAWNMKSYLATSSI